MMKYSIRLIVFALTPVLFGQSVEVAAFSRSTLTVPSQGSGGPILLEARQLQVHLRLPQDREEDGVVTVVFDPASRCFLWRYLSKEAGVVEGFRTAFINRQAAIYAFGEKLVEFQFAGGLGVKEWTTKAETLDNAETLALGEIRHALSASPSEVLGDNMKEIPMPNLGGDFRCAPLSAICNTPIQIAGITYAANKWNISIESLGTAELVLDKDFHVIDAVRTK